MWCVLLFFVCCCGCFDLFSRAAEVEEESSSAAEEPQPFAFSTSVPPAVAAAAEATGASALAGWRFGISNRVVPVCQVEDVLIASGGLALDGVSLFGSDDRLRHGEPYPGMASLLYLLSRGPFPAGKSARRSMTRAMALPSLASSPFPLLLTSMRQPLLRNDQDDEGGNGANRTTAAAAGSAKELAVAAAIASVRDLQLELVQEIVNRELQDAARKVTRQENATWLSSGWWPTTPMHAQRRGRGAISPDQVAAHLLEVSQGATQALGSQESFIHFFSASTREGVLFACSSAFVERNLATFLQVPSELHSSADEQLEQLPQLPAEARLFAVTRLGHSKPREVPGVLLTYDVSIEETVAVDIPSSARFGGVASSLLGLLATQLALRVESVIRYFSQEPMKHELLPIVFVKFREVDVERTVDAQHGHPSIFLENRDEADRREKGTAELRPVVGSEDEEDVEDALKGAIPIALYRTTISAAAQAMLLNLIGAADFAEFVITTVKDLRSRGPLFQPATHAYLSDLKSDWEDYVRLARTEALVADKQLVEVHSLLGRVNEDFAAARVHCLKKYVLSLPETAPLFDFTKDFCYNFPEILYPSSAGGAEFATYASAAGLALRALFAAVDWPGVQAPAVAAEEARAVASRSETSRPRNTRGPQAPASHPRRARQQKKRPETREGAGGRDPEAVTPTRRLAAEDEEEEEEEEQQQPVTPFGEEAEREEKSDAAESAAAAAEAAALGCEEEPSDSIFDGRGEAANGGGARSAETVVDLAAPVPQHDGEVNVEGEELQQAVERRSAETAAEEKESAEEEPAPKQKAPVATFGGHIPKDFAALMQGRFGPGWVSLLQVLGSPSVANDYLRVLNWLSGKARSNVLMLPTRRLLVRRDAEVSTMLSTALRQQLQAIYQDDLEGELTNPVGHKNQQDLKSAEEGLKLFQLALSHFAKKK